VQLGTDLIELVVKDVKSYIIRGSGFSNPEQQVPSSKWLYPSFIKTKSLSFIRADKRQADMLMI
jgi:hypothetical protein